MCPVSYVSDIIFDWWFSCFPWKQSLAKYNMIFAQHQQFSFVQWQFPVSFLRYTFWINWDFIQQYFHSFTLIGFIIYAKLTFVYIHNTFWNRFNKLQQSLFQYWQCYSSGLWPLRSHSTCSILKGWIYFYFHSWSILLHMRNCYKTSLNLPCHKKLPIKI